MEPHTWQAWLWRLTQDPRLLWASSASAPIPRRYTLAPYSAFPHPPTCPKSSSPFSPPRSQVTLSWPPHPFWLILKSLWSLLWLAVTPATGFLQGCSAYHVLCDMAPTASPSPALPVSPAEQRRLECLMRRHCDRTGPCSQSQTWGLTGCVCT